MVFVASYVDRRVVPDGNTALIHAHARVPEEAPGTRSEGSVTTGDAHLQRWIGPDAARASFLALAVAVGVGAIWVAVRSTNDPATRPAWLLGAVAGAGVGLIVATLYLIMAGVASNSAGLQLAPELVSLALLLGPPVVGLVAAGTHGTTSAGAVAGFWFAFALALVADLGLIASDSLFSSRLLQTAWANYSSGDRLCTGVHGATLLGCAVGDDLGFAATLLVLGPVLGLGLGALAGVVGRARRRGTDGHLLSSPGRRDDRRARRQSVVIFAIRAAVQYGWAKASRLSSHATL